MATYFVDSTRADDTGAGTSWATAKKTFAAGLALATTAGDVVKVSHTHKEELSADTVFTMPASILVISVNKDSSDAATAMGTGGWIGNSTTNRSVIVEAAAYSVHFHGITFRTAGSTADSISISYGNGQVLFESGYLWSGNTNNSATINLAGASAGNESKLIVRNTTFRFGATSQSLTFNGHLVVIEGGSISADGSAITILVSVAVSPGTILFSGVDLSAMGSSGTLMTRTANGQKTAIFQNCKLPASLTTVLATTNAHGGESEAYIYNCSSADKNYIMEYHNAYGSLTTIGQEISGAVYANDNPTYDGTNKCSWKIVTTANARFTSPFTTPWIERYHGATSAITPYLEILRDGSTTAYKNSEVWSEWSYQGTSGFPRALFVDDRQEIGAYANGTAGSDQDAGMGTGSWTGDSGAWSGKLGPTSSFTPQEIGHIMARVSVGVASSTVYVDPSIRGTS